MRLDLIYALTASCTVAGLSAQGIFPPPRGSTTLLPTLWTQSTIVVVGEVTNVSSYGEQAVNSLPPPMALEVNRLYWCQGEFIAKAVIKGRLPVPPRKYLWASAVAGCELYDNDPEHTASRYRTRAWFVREEGGFLRPVYDYGTHKFVGVCAVWTYEDGRAPRQRLGTLLLTPTANCESMLDYAEYFSEQAGDLACEVLGESECGRQILELTHDGNAVMRKAACDYLRVQLRRKCE